MAETNGPMTPPLFREALVQAGPWTMTDSWQRWLSAFWQQQIALWERPGYTNEQAQDAVGTILTEGPTVEWVYEDATPAIYAQVKTQRSIMYDANGLMLHGDVLTPGAAMLYGTSPSGTKGWYAQPSATTLGLGSGAFITASGTATHVALWSNATTLIGTDSIQVGAGWKVGLNSYPPPVNVGLRGYTTSLNSLRLDGTDTLARWSLDCPGQGHILQLGVYYGPDTAATDGVDLRVYRGRFDNLAVGRAIDLGYALLTQGANHFTGTLWNSGAVALGSTLQVSGLSGFGYAPDGTHFIRAGSCRFDPSGFGGVYDTRFTIRNYGNMYCDGVPYLPAGGPWVTYSDERLKHHIQDIPRPLETLCALRGILYEWRDPRDGQQPGVHMGVLAQEVEEVLPEWVGELSGYKTTQLSRFEALTIEAIKALTARVAVLEGA